MRCDRYFSKNREISPATQIGPGFRGANCNEVHNFDVGDIDDTIVASTATSSLF